MTLADIVGLLNVIALFTAIVAGILIYQKHVGSKKWKCILSLALYGVFAFGTAVITGLMTGRQMIDITLSRYIFMVSLALCTVICAFLAWKHK